MEEICKAYFLNTFKSKGDGDISGIIKSKEKYESFLLELTSNGFSFSVRSSETKSTKTESVFIESGIPCTTLQWIYLQCCHGNLYYEINKSNSNQDHPAGKKRRFHFQDSKKIGCPSKLNVKVRHVYPEYQVDPTSQSNWMKRKMAQEMKSKISQDLNLKKETWYFIEGLTKHNHEISGQKKVIHPELKARISQLVENGVTSIHAIKLQLKEKVREIFQRQQGPDILNSSFFPNDKVIYSHVYNTLFEIKGSKSDQEALEKKINMWKKDNDLDEFYFRKYMTIKESLPCYLRIMDHSLFQNPKKQPIEELKIKYVPNDSSYEELIPVLVSRMKNISGETSFANVCRICTCNDEMGKMISLFGNNDILEKISSFLPITIHEGDSLPHQVCEKCFVVIESSFELINKAQSSEKYFNCLKNVQKKIKVEEESFLDQPEDNLANNKKHPLSLDLDGSFDCDICGLQLSEAFELDTHIQEKHFNQTVPPNTEFSVHKICSLCGQLFDCEEGYVLHKCQSHHKCAHCSKVMPSKCLLNRHIQHSCKQLYYCPYCHKTFSVKVSFMKHVQAHTGEEYQIECLACDKKRQGPGEITEHTCNQSIEENSSSSKKFRCYICGQAYKRQLNLARHCLQHEPKATWKFKCQKCDEIFEKERTLHSHYEKVHKMPKTWVCRFCGKSLSTKLSVQIHERIHTQVKPYVCEWCGNAFRSKANLIQHHAKHTGIRRHKCPVCGKMFSRTFFLKTHLRVHTGERPYQCDICEQRFTQVGDMRRHRKRHDQTNNVSQPTVIIVRRSGQAPPSPNLPVVTFDSLPIETVELKIETSKQ